MQSSKVTLLRDVVVPKKFYERIKTGSEVLDNVFGGDRLPGIMPGGQYLFTGTSGAGKSTFSLQLADALARAGLSVLYNLGEETKYQVKIAADRIKIGGNFPISEFDDVNELLIYVLENDIDVLFQDSLQSLTDALDPDMYGPKLWLHIGKKLLTLKDNDVTTFMVGHVTKGGEFAGKNELKHDVDAHVHMTLNKDNGNRILEFTKNRFGPAQMPYEFVLSADGLDLKQVAEGTTPEGTKRTMVRDEFVEAIKKLMVDGVKLSGYSHEELDELKKFNRSGGFMRGALRIAIKELEANGAKVVTGKINNREHSWVED